MVYPENSKQPAALTLMKARRQLEHNMRKCFASKCCTINKTALIQYELHRKLGKACYQQTVNLMSVHLQEA